MHMKSCRHSCQQGSMCILFCAARYQELKSDLSVDLNLMFCGWTLEYIPGALSETTFLLYLI